MVLDRINQANDIKYLNEAQLEELPNPTVPDRTYFKNRWSSGLQSWCGGTYYGAASGTEFSGG